MNFKHSFFTDLFSRQFACFKKIIDVILSRFLNLPETRSLLSNTNVLFEFLLTS